jgi:hypothetical protein
MQRLVRVFRLPAREKALLVQATLLLAAIRLGLSWLPFATVRGMLARLAAIGNRKDQQSEDSARATERSVWAIETAGRHFPKIGTCLHQALAAYVLLARRGCRSNLRIGVKRSADGKFAGHAWLEKDGHILIGGGAHRATYIPMPMLNGLELHGALEAQQDLAIQWFNDRPSTPHDAGLKPTRLD